MKLIQHIITVLIAGVSLLANTCWAEPSLSSLMTSFPKEPECSGRTFMGAKFSIMIRPSTSQKYRVGSGETIDLCLSKRYPFQLNNRPAGTPFYEFHGTGPLDFDGGPNGSFELRLGQSTALLRDLGSLTITFPGGGTRTLRLPNSLTISDNGLFIHGELEGGQTVITILIRHCQPEGCFP